VSKFFIVLLALLALAFGAHSVSAQDEPSIPMSVYNYVFTSEPVKADPPSFGRVTGEGNVNVRMIPDATDDNSVLTTITTGATVQNLYQYEDWTLGRVLHADGSYAAMGWISNDAAGFAPIEFEGSVHAAPCLPAEGFVQMFVVVRFGTGWVGDSLMSSCPLFAEGRQVEEEYHGYWVIREVRKDESEVLIETTANYLPEMNGLFWLLEGTSWTVPENWNVSDFDIEGEEAVISIHARDKQVTMMEEGYRWPFRVYDLTNNMVEYPFGTFGDPLDQDRCALDEPRRQNITGIFNTSTLSFRSVSVGAIGCRSIFIWQSDEDPAIEVQMITGTDENLSYSSIWGAWLMPSSWSDETVKQFTMEQVAAIGFPTGNTMDISGVPGLDDGNYNIGGE
jgi:hypothetical protein